VIGLLSRISERPQNGVCCALRTASELLQSICLGDSGSGCISSPYMWAVMHWPSPPFLSGMQGGAPLCFFLAIGLIVQSFFSSPPVCGLVSRWPSRKRSFRRLAAWPLVALPCWPVMSTGELVRHVPLKGSKWSVCRLLAVCAF
jgi:hypothetical protein